MNIICKKTDLMEGINTVQKAVSTKSTLQVLEGIMLEAGQELKLIGNDLEIAIDCIVDATIKEEGKIVINSKIFGEIVRRLPDADVKITSDDKSMIKIECENSHFELIGYNAESFPPLPQIEKKDVFRLRQNTLKEMIRQTIFAVSSDDNRPVLTGTLIESSGSSITFVSCDSYRVAIRIKKTQENLPSINIVIPGKTLNEISKIIQGNEDNVDIYCGKNQILFDMGKSRMVSRLLEGEYFKYKSFITDEYETKITINTNMLLRSLERASLLISNEERKYPVNFNIKGDSLKIYTSSNLGNVNESINVETEGKDLEIRFNPRYFIEALKVIDEEYVNICFTGETAPCIIKPLEGNEFVYLIVPLRK